MLTLARLFASKPPRCYADDAFVRLAGADWSKSIMQEAVTDRLHEKQGRSIARWTLSSGNETLVMYLKRHYRLPFWRGLMARLWPFRSWSPGWQEREHLQWAEARGFPVPRTLAAAEWRGPGFKLQSVLAVQELSGMLALHEAIPLALLQLSKADFGIWKRKLIIELARLSRKLHLLSAFHKDLYLCHFYIREADCEAVPESFADRMVMIDLHRLGTHPILHRHFQIKDLAQLLYSTVDVDGITDRDRLRFWKHYRPGSPRWLRKAVALKYLLYLRHARRKARRKGL